MPGIANKAKPCGREPTRSARPARWRFRRVAYRRVRHLPRHRLSAEALARLRLALADTGTKLARCMRDRCGDPSKCAAIIRALRREDRRGGWRFGNRPAASRCAPEKLQEQA